MSMTANETSLFDVEGPESPAVPQPIRPEQVLQIREAFQESGIQGQGERKALIESVVVREVASLRELRAVEAKRVLLRIKDIGAAKPISVGSAWDNRDEDTWIDKL